MNGKILIIDEDMKFIRTISQVLEAEKYEVISPNDFDKDFDFDYFNAPDLIILEIMMLSDDIGIKFLKSIKNIMQENHIPIIAVTDIRKRKFVSNDFYADIDWGLVKNTANKPIKASELLKRIRYVLSNCKIAA